MISKYRIFCSAQSLPLIFQLLQKVGSSCNSLTSAPPLFHWTLFSFLYFATFATFGWKDKLREMWQKGLQLTSCSHISKYSDKTALSKCIFLSEASWTAASQNTFQNFVKYVVCVGWGIALKKDACPFVCLSLLKLAKPTLVSNFSKWTNENCSWL